MKRVFNTVPPHPRDSRVFADARPEGRPGDQHSARLREHQAEPDAGSGQDAGGRLQLEARHDRGGAAVLCGHRPHRPVAHSGPARPSRGVPNPMPGQESRTGAEDEGGSDQSAGRSRSRSATRCSAQTTDENATQFIKVGQNEVTRAAALFGFIAHGNEIYGTGAVYLRSKNLVPPSTERMMQGRGRGN